MVEHILEVRDLTKIFETDDDTITAVDKIKFQLSGDQFYTMLGPSGCGKTTMANLILLLHPPTDGEILFRDKPITGLSDRERKEYARHVQVVFQDPYGALNPRMRIGDIVGEPMEIHGFSANEKRAAVLKA